MLIRIILNSRISCETTFVPDSSYPNPKINYILEMWIDRVAVFDPDTGTADTDHPAIPKELFLYRKLSDALDVYLEPLLSSLFVRVAEPEDLASVNPVRFGTENLVWGITTDAGTTLMKSVIPAGAPLQRNDAPSAVAPKKAFSKSGYFKSRLFVLNSPDAEIISTNYNSIKRNLTAFVQKYLASTSVTEDIGEAWAEKTF